MGVRSLCFMIALASYGRAYKLREQLLLDLLVRLSERPPPRR